MSNILIEGYTADEVLSFSEEEIERIAFDGKPFVFKIGSANVLAEFSFEAKKIIVELAQIDGGGEGILPTLSSLLERYAKVKGLEQIEWIVYATNCAKPNMKLRRLLERRGFVIKEIKGKGEAYYFLQEIT